MDKFRRVVGILLIIIGVVIIGDVAYKKIITLKKQKEIVELFENGFSEGTSTEGATESSESVNLDEINGYKPIAIIEIPSINLSKRFKKASELGAFILNCMPLSILPILLVNANRDNNTNN